ncbi:MAG: YihA family ribosome biogenesis GTP-binding protein [Clostridia bacterium]|nr:YihA family ribosome biogenesis GTP-binding protein [Clostridia bacterium]
MKVNVHKAEFLLSAVKKEHYPVTSMPEVAFIGRSNVGKSSMINKILNRKNFARVSQKPGKTVTINFYNIDDKLMLVDLPGYGYAQASHGERKAMTGIIGDYLSERRQLMQVILLVDCRHKPTQDDKDMARAIKSSGGQLVVFATKSDKLGKMALEKNLEMLIEELDLEDGDILIPFSTQNTEGAETFWDYIYDFILEDE